MILKVVFVMIVSLISILDLIYLRVYDFSLFFLFSIYFIVLLLTNKNEIISHLISGFLFFILFYFIFAFTNGLGFGDVKFVFVISFWLGFFQSISAYLLSCLFALVYIVGNQLISKQNVKKIPFCPFLSTGSSVVLLIGDLI